MAKIANEIRSITVERNMPLMSHKRIENRSIPCPNKGLDKLIPCTYKYYIRKGRLWINMPKLLILVTIPTTVI